MSKKTQVVVTGASGFVARNVRKYLSQNNFKLISISRKNFKKLKLKKSKMRNSCLKFDEKLKFEKSKMKVLRF